MNLAIDFGFPHSPRNQLRDLGTEIENQNLVVGHEAWEGDEGRAGSKTRELQSTSLDPHPSTLAPELVDLIVGRFLDDLHVVHMGFPHTRGRDLHELRAFLDGVDVRAAQVAHR